MKIDLGIDAIAKTANHRYIAIQIKFRTQQKTLTLQELSTFLALSEHCHKRVVISNCRQISQNITSYNLDFIGKDDFIRLNSDEIKTLWKPIVHKFPNLGPLWTRL